MDTHQPPIETPPAIEASVAQVPAALFPERTAQDPLGSPGRAERLFRLKSVVALALGSLILGGAGGAALGAVSGGSDSDPGGRFGGPPSGQPGQQGQIGQPGQPSDDNGSAPGTNR